jgi:hypothetical protein
MMTVDEAIAAIVATYGDIDAVARSLPVDAAEIAAATAEPDTAEAVALALLQKYNMTAPVVVIEEVSPKITK